MTMKVLAIGLAACMMSAPALSQTVIDTVQPYSISIQPFGDPNTSAYGQTFTVGGDTYLDSFSFFLTNSVINQVDFRSYVYAWDGTRAVGPELYQSGLQSFSGSPNNVPTEYSFSTGSIGLTSGAQYVAFLFADFSGISSVAGMPASTENYAGGDFVYSNVGSNFGALTSSNWDYRGGGNFADVWFRAALSRENVAAVPEPATWAMMLIGFGGIGLSMRRNRRTRRAALSAA